MNCRELVEFLMQYLDGDLPPAEATHFEEHVQMCPPCLAYLETYRAAIRAGKKVCCHEEESLRRAIPEELVQAILAARRASSS
ncbi:MAG: zf-HC2 domain-containing protein [Candidatus Eisenbacteria bacterium]